MNVFIGAILRIFSFGERLIVPFNSAIASMNGTINLSPHENILTIAVINIHYLYIDGLPLTSRRPCWRYNTKEYVINSIVGSCRRAWLTLSAASREIDCKPRILYMLEPLQTPAHFKIRVVNFAYNVFIWQTSLL